MNTGQMNTFMEAVNITAVDNDLPQQKTYLFRQNAECDYSTSIRPLEPWEAIRAVTEYSLADTTTNSVSTESKIKSNQNV